MRAWISATLALERVELLPVSVEIAVLAGSLPAPFPGDPADRLIYATASAYDAPLATRDGKIRDFDPDRTVW